MARWSESIDRPNNRRYRWPILIGAGVGLVVLTLIGVSLGSLHFSLGETVSALWRGSSNPTANQVVHNLRLPRILIAVLVGMGMGAAGGILQSVLRNPLASPQIIGVNTGAGLLAVAVMVLAPGRIGLIPPAAFAGALAAAVLVYALGVGLGATRSSTAQIVLAGVAVSAFFGAATSSLMIAFSDELAVTYTWLIGGLSGRGWNNFNLLWPYSLSGLLLAVLLAPALNLFSLGDDVGRSLGLSVGVYRAGSIFVAAWLAGSAVSVAGTVGFVGLIAPHAARLLVGEDYRFMLPLSALLGGLLLSTADTTARTVFMPVELPVGVLTAALGAPFFLLLLRRSRRSR
jgi:iron complex transport system permease protein